MKLSQLTRNFATYSPDDPSGGDDDNAAPPPAEPTAPEAAKTFSQSEVNAIVATEKAKAVRSANRKAKAPQSEEPQASSDTAMILGLIQGMKDDAVADRKAASDAITKREGEAAFAADISALTLDDDAKSLLATLRDHNPEAYARQLASHRATSLPPDPKGPGVTTPGAPSGESGAPDPMNPTSWSKDDIAAMKKAGTFRENLTKSRNAMPGGRGGLFPRKR